MTEPSSSSAPVGYRVRVGGVLDLHWSPWLAGFTVTADRDGTTTLTGVAADQAQLHGLLTKIRDLGIVLLSVTALDPPRGRAGPPSQKP
ncbi:MAG TPA: hypothetical protein VFJ94_10615 [Intrasporangium sp.]|uniref:hypothetical protein n=1 Tax=Intrasporangium sp. TaxID=1925024 RepID=UPI002D7870D3|nr:hypothetical protein [Intrasporangium sp.]HET7398962.1 hypothetical protein [Intrasporangium sp.]